MVIELGPARSPIEVAGFVSDTTFNGQASLWASPDTWREVLGANRPDAQLGPDVWQGLIVRGDGDDLPEAIDAATGGATASFTVDEAVEAIPGVSGSRARTFNQIIGVTVAIALVVIALFFALLTVERTSTLRRPEGPRREVVDHLRRPRRSRRWSSRRSLRSSAGTLVVLLDVLSCRPVRSHC
jgi:hypothetical protein